MQGFSCRLHKIHVNIYKVEINSLSSFGHLLNNICYYEKHGLIWYVGFCGSGCSGDYFLTLFTKLYLNISIFTHWTLLNYYLQWEMTARQNLTFKSVNIFYFFYINIGQNYFNTVIKLHVLVGMKDWIKDTAAVWS